MGFTVLFTTVAGSLVLFGPLAYALTTTVEGAAFGGLSGLLIGWGMRHEKAIEYPHSIEGSDYLFTVSGDEALVNRACWVLKNQAPMQMDFLTPFSLRWH